MVILFSECMKNKIMESHGNVVIHAYPGSVFINREGLKEYYLSGFGTPSQGLEKITTANLAKSIHEYEQINLI